MDCSLRLYFGIISSRVHPAASRFLCCVYAFTRGLSCAVPADWRASWQSKDAVRKLFSLQSSKSVRAQLIRNRIAGKAMKSTNVEEMEKLLNRTGLSLSRLDELPVIHVAGTKGKGSTCSMCESILRRHGFRTGLFTGPHLVQPRERIQLDGRSLAQEKFATHVQRIYGLLLDTQENGCAMPGFFSFMTLVAFHVFLEERVDVAVVEVGFGGIDDSTNVLRKVPVVGITSLGLDHIQVLGETLAEITAAKAGIMKRGCQAYTAPQLTEAMDVLKARAHHLNCSLAVVPQLSHYTFPESEGPRLPVDVPTYRTNASLAVQLAHAWMRVASGNISPQLVYEVPRETAAGLSLFRWPGRYHVVDQHYANFYLDAAHTKESMEVCAKWFSDTTYSERSTDKILMYTCTPERDVTIQFQYLQKIPFKQVYFVSRNIFKGTLSQEEQEEYKQMHRKYMQLWKNSDSGAEVIEFECVNDALNCVKKQNEKPSILITGSIYLIGAVLSIIDPKSVSM